MGHLLSLLPFLAWCGKYRGKDGMQFHRRPAHDELIEGYRQARARLVGARLGFDDVPEQHVTFTDCDSAVLFHIMSEACLDLITWLCRSRIHRRLQFGRDFSSCLHLTT